MHPVETIARQTEDAYRWVHQLVDDIPDDQWDTVPAGLDTHVTWQVGHLLMSYYFHTMMVIEGHQKDLMGTIPFRDYDGFFTRGAPADSVGKLKHDQLREHLSILEKRSLKIIRSLSEEDLNSALVPTKFPHPIANTKWEALDWNVKHTMWHCGQLGMLKRMVDKGLDFRQLGREKGER